MNKKIAALMCIVVLLFVAKYIFATTEGFEIANEQFFEFCVPFLIVYVMWVLGVFDSLFSPGKENLKSKEERN